MLFVCISELCVCLFVCVVLIIRSNNSLSYRLGVHEPGADIGKCLTV